jgi:hypothetical protein
MTTDKSRSDPLPQPTTPVGRGLNRPLFDMNEIIAYLGLAFSAIVFNLFACNLSMILSNQGSIEDQPARCYPLYAITLPVFIWSIKTLFSI